MKSFDDFRLEAYKLLLELDAATTGMMMLVSARQNCGPEWDNATCRHQQAYEAWVRFLGDQSRQPPLQGPERGRIQ
ncbi:hypothetical protein BLX41_31635 [Pseudomonas protegens]|uniref:hypothetical protein n=1 Tax=Pseudomonas protegens TaxID=380021 RepID=UPI000F4B4CF9|nr:hypothetical protein [Pseudomonas protegens]ROL62637.1 hypothetical protein BLX41_31635 [Pseudomonas protegens]